MNAAAQTELFGEPPPRPGWAWTHRWRLRRLPAPQWSTRSSGRHGQRVRVVARGRHAGPHNLLVEFEDGHLVVGTRECCEPRCCRHTAVYLFKAIGFRSYWCPRCDEIFDIFDCCGHRHQVQQKAEAASGFCHGCGTRRSSGDKNVIPNSIGEATMREIAVIRARREHRRGR